VSFWSLKTMVIPEGNIPAADSARTSRVKPRFVRFSRRERKWNVRLHARENHLGNAFDTLRRTPPMEAIIIPREIKEVQPQVRPACGTEVPQTFPFNRRGSFLWKTRIDRRGYRDNKVIGGTQRRKELNS